MTLLSYDHARSLSEVGQGQLAARSRERNCILLLPGLQGWRDPPIDGLKWLSAIFKDRGREQYWRDREGTGESLVNLLDTALREEAPVLAKDREAREALVALAAYVATRQVPAALALQERIKHLNSAGPTAVV